MVVRDKVGQVITPGCYLAYGHALGRCAGLRIGKVLGLKSWEEARGERTRRVYRLQVQGVDDDWSHRDPALTSRVGVLQYPERTLVLQPSQLPPVYWQLLATIPLLEATDEP